MNICNEYNVISHNCEERSLIKIQFESKLHSSTALLSLLLRENPNILCL